MYVEEKCFISFRLAATACTELFLDNIQYTVLNRDSNRGIYNRNEKRYYTNRKQQAIQQKQHPASIKADEKNQIKVGSCYSDQQRAFLAVELDIYRRVLMVKVLIADPYCIAVLCIYTSAGESLCGPYLLQPKERRKEQIACGSFTTQQRKSCRLLRNTI